MSKESRRPTASCSVGGATGHVSSYSLKAAINSYPTATVTFHKKGSGGAASQVLGEEMISSLAGHQQNMFSLATSPNLTLNLTDGQGGTINFGGFISSPGVTVGSGEVAQRITAVHAASLMDSLKLSIYSPTGNSANLTDLKSSAGAWSTRLKELTEKMIELWEKKPGTGDMVAIKRSIHEQNKSFLPAWLQILNNSTESTTQAALGQLNAHPRVDQSINQALRMMLQSNRPQFIEVMMAINGSVQMTYAPGLDQDDFGRLILTGKLMENEEEGTVAVVRANASLGNIRNLAVGQVVVSGVSFDDEINIRGLGSAAAPLKYDAPVPKLLVRYPDRDVTGIGVNEVPLPSFIPNRLDTGPFRDVRGIGRNSDSSYTMARAASIKLSEYTRGPLKEFLTDYAKNIYIDTALSGAMFTLHTDLNFSWKPGSYYSVTGPSGKMFNGLLASCTHDVSLSQDNASANTALQFVLVEMNGFTLPDK